MEKVGALQRKYWPFIGLLYTILSPLLLLNFVTFIGAPEPLYFSWAALSIFIKLTFLFILWICAYKKPGTKLITLYLLSKPLFWFDILLQLLGLRSKLYFTEEFNSFPVSYLREGPWTIKTLLFTTGYVFLFLSFYFSSWVLRKQNKRMKLLNQIDVDVAASIQLLYKEEDLDSLNQKYSELVNQWPKFEPITSSHYKLCKASLEKRNTL